MNLSLMMLETYQFLSCNLVYGPLNFFGMKYAFKFVQNFIK